MKLPRFLMKSPFSDISDRLWTEAWDEVMQKSPDLNVSEEDILDAAQAIRDTLEKEGYDNRKGAIE